MRIAETLLPQLDHENGLTRKLLERLPESQAAFKPHPKSMALGELGMHITAIAGWALPTLTQTEFDFAAPESARFHPQPFTTTRDMLALLDRAVVAARAALVPLDDDAMRATWTLRVGSRVVFAMPRVGVVRGFILSHAIHHRGQLEVYLRMLGVALPSLYGPSADEPA